MILLVWV